MIVVDKAEQFQHNTKVVGISYPAKSNLSPSISESNTSSGGLTRSSVFKARIEQKTNTRPEFSVSWVTGTLGLSCLRLPQFSIKAAHIVMLAAIKEIGRGTRKLRTYFRNEEV